MLSHSIPLVMAPRLLSHGTSVWTKRRFVDMLNLLWIIYRASTPASFSNQMQMIRCTCRSDSALTATLYNLFFSSIIRIPFTGSVRLRSLLLKTGHTGHPPLKVALVTIFGIEGSVLCMPDMFWSIQYANEASLDFEDIADKNPSQEFNVAEGKEVGEYAVMYVLPLPRYLLRWCYALPHLFNWFLHKGPPNSPTYLASRYSFLYLLRKTWTPPLGYIMLDF